METPTVQTAYDYGTPKYAGQRMTQADFLRWESDDNYVYEFVDGILEPTTGAKQSENYVLTNLENQFFRAAAFQNGDRLRAEMDVWVSDTQLRRPDVSYFSTDQIQQMAGGQKVIPGFVAEFVSENDDMRKYIRKLTEYFAAGVRVVWLVFPDDYTVYVYTSPKNVTICTENDLLRAAPALPEFQMTVAELFRR